MRRRKYNLRIKYVPRIYFIKNKNSKGKNGAAANDNMAHVKCVIGVKQDELSRAESKRAGPAGNSSARSTIVMPHSVPRTPPRHSGPHPPVGFSSRFSYPADISWETEKKKNRKRGIIQIQLLLLVVNKNYFTVQRN